MNQLKLLFFTITLFSSFQIQGQCKPVFRRMMNQPPAAPAGYYFQEGFTTYNHFPFCISYISNDTNSLSDSLYINYFADSAWHTLPKLYMEPGSNYLLHQFNNKIYLQGNWSKINNITAPAGKNLTLIECKGGVWDTVPGTTIPDSGFNSDQYALNKDGLYRIIYKDSTAKYFLIGQLQKFDSASQKFITRYRFTNYGYYSYLFKGNNRILISNTGIINSVTSNSFSYLENDSLYINTDSRFNLNGDYYIDPVDDHIYLVSYGANPIIREFDQSYVGIRNTSTIPFKGIGDLGVYDGKFVFATFDDDENRYINILCRNSSTWKSIVQKSFGGWGNNLVSNSGIQAWDYNTRSVLELGEGFALTGKCYIDIDSNCTYTSGIDQPIKNRIVTAKSDHYSAGGLTDSNGNYELFVVEDTFSLSGPSTLSTCMIDTVHMGTVPSVIKNIPIKTPDSFDLRARFLNSFAARWNSSFIYEVNIQNNGKKADSAVFSINIDPKLTPIAFDTSVAKLIGNTLIGKFKNLEYFDTRTFTYSSWIDTSTTKPDTILNHSLSAYINGIDKDSSNNIDELQQIVVYSYDPNYITCNKKTILPKKEYKLEYFIEFQNEGNDNAYDVVITDKLPGSLNIETFEALGASHPYTLSLNNGLLTITFKNIQLLPKKTSEEGSKGFFKFSINTMGNLKNNTEIKNYANIYFDLNSPVTTNVNIVTVHDPSTDIRIIEYDNNALGIYPNPGHSIVNLINPEKETVYIYNSIGVLIQIVNGNDGDSSIDVSNWPSGIYFFRSKNGYLTFTKANY